MPSFKIAHTTVDVFPSEKPARPIVYLNTYGHEGEQIAQELKATGCPDLTLVAISDLEWDHDMAPWDIPPISKNDTPCTGGADDYLHLLIEQILPKAEESVAGTPAWRGIAGYSLAGLFAVYAMYRTDVFSRIASMSGSLWFPHFKEFVFSHEPKRTPDRLYFSLGDREHRTRNEFLKCVRQNTEEIEAFFESRGISTVFELNPGNHFKDDVGRTVAGIRWIASDSDQ